MNSNCEDCIRDCQPSDPRKPVYMGNGKYMKPICYGCPSWKEEELIKPEPDFDNKQWDTVQQLRAQVQFLHKKVTEKRVLPTEKPPF